LIFDGLYGVIAQNIMLFLIRGYNNLDYKRSINRTEEISTQFVKKCSCNRSKFVEIPI
jgi:hypothetical protein